MPPLYESFLERNPEEIRAAIRDYRASHSLDDLFGQIAQFAVLSYAPSQHGKHAMIACLSAHEIGASDELLTQCAIYAAASRQPWSEPPIDTPPEPSGRGDLDELREAIAGSDHLRGERWLTRRLADGKRDYFTAATDDFEDFGHKLIVAAAAWKLAAMFPPAARFATLRVGIREMTAYHGERYEEEGVALDTETLLERLIAEMVADQGGIVTAHQIFVLDAALQTEDDFVILRVRDYLTSVCGPASAGQTHDRLKPILTPYLLARDYGALLKSHAVAKRLRPRFPNLDFDGMLAAAQYNLEHAPSFEEFSFA